MTEQDRGAYAPQADAPLTFDPRDSGRRSGPAPLTLIISAIVLIVLVVGLVFLYRHGVRKPGQPPQVVGAPVGATKSPPPSSTAAESDETASLQVYKTEVAPSGASPQASLAPAPEQPLPRPVTHAPTPPVSVAPLRAAEPAPSAPVKPVTLARDDAAAARRADSSWVAGSAFGNHAGPSTPPSTKPTTAEAAPAPKPPKPAAVTPAPAAAGGVYAQIGAFTSSALAEKGWSDAAHKSPAQMAGKSRKVETTSKDGKTFYRALVGGFASRADAVSFCTALRAAGTNCIVK